MTKFHLKKIATFTILTSFIFFSAGSFATNANTNQVDFALISDPHVDINKTKAVNINPTPIYKGADLDKPSFVTIMTKLSNKIPQLPEHPSFVVALGDLPSHN